MPVLAATDAFGGGNGFAVGKDAPPEAVEFLEYATSIDVANRWGETNSGILPVTLGSEGSITDPYLQDVIAARADAEYVQLYLDQAYDPELGADINDAVEQLSHHLLIHGIQPPFALADQNRFLRPIDLHHIRLHLPAPVAADDLRHEWQRPLHAASPDPLAL